MRLIISGVGCLVSHARYLCFGWVAAGRCVLTRRSAVVAKGWYVALRSVVVLQLSRRHPCAAVAGGSHRVAASGGQGGPGGLRVPPTPSLDSLLAPLYRRRSAMGLEAAERRVLARRSAVVARGRGVALRSIVAVRLARLVLAPHLAAIAAAWQPPAAKEGQGDCDFPLGPPWILLYPLKRRRSARGGGGEGWPLRGRRGGDWELCGG